MKFNNDDWFVLEFPKARLKHTSGKNWQGEPINHQKYYTKLSQRYYGPFQIQKPINEITYKLKLPSHWKIHNAFHVSLLKKFQGTSPMDPIHEDPPKFDEVKEIFQLKIIIQHEDNLLQSGKVFKYPIKFKKLFL